MPLDGPEAAELQPYASRKRELRDNSRGLAFGRDPPECPGKASHDGRDRQPITPALQREARLFSESAAIRRLSSWLRSPSSTPCFGSS
jgi:hypothetical protein